MLPVSKKTPVAGTNRPRAGSTRNAGSRRLTFIITATGVVGLVAWIDVYELRIETISQAISSPGWLAVGAALFLLPMLVHTLRYQLLLRSFMSVPTGFVLKLVLACTFVNHFVVAHAGDFAEPLWLQRRVGASYWLGLQVGLLRFAHSAAALLILAAFAWGAWSTTLGLSLHPLLAWLPLSLGLPGIGIVLALAPGAARRWEKLEASVGPGDIAFSPPVGSHAWVRRLRKKGLDLLQASERVPPLWHAFFIALAVLELALDGLPYLFFAWAVGIDLPVGSLLTSAVTLNVIEYMPTPPAMLGVQSWVATFSLVSAATPAAALAVAVALHRTLRTAVIALVGVLPLVALSREYSRSPGEDA